MRIAVTGSGGFIGTHLVRQLKVLGHDVLEISRKKDLHITDWHSVMDLPACDSIIHLAGKTFVPESFNRPREFYEVNIRATLNALELARMWKCRLINMSSYFYGAPQYIPVDELHPIAPHNPYAQTKYIAEELCSAYQRDFSVPVVSFRLFNLYGPEQTGSLLIPEILQQIPSGKVVLKDPRPKRDYIHIDDVVNALISATAQRISGFAVFNLGTGISTSIEELVKYMKQASPTEFEVKFTHEYRRGEVLDSMASLEKIEKALGWRPTITLEEGVKTLFF